MIQYNDAITLYDAVIAKDTITATSFIAKSDKRLKTNIKPFKTDKSILDVEVKEFDYINSNIHSLGMIAQDLQKVFPELVMENESGYLSIVESKLVYLLINEVKDLKSQVNSLK